MSLLDELERRSVFGVKPGLESIANACASFGNPQKNLRAIHVAGTNGKGAVCAILDAALRGRLSVGRYTSPHLVNVNERFFLNGKPVPIATLDSISGEIAAKSDTWTSSLTYFEYLTLVAFVFYSRARPDFTILETGLGGRLDATNVCEPCLTVITRIGLDHCAILGGTIEAIAAEKAGIIKPGAPVVLGRNAPEAIEIVRRRAAAVGAPFVYAPDIASEDEIPEDFSLLGSFNRENATTAIAAIKTLFTQSSSLHSSFPSLRSPTSLSTVVWPGRCQRIRRFIVDGAHNPPAARALSAALDEMPEFQTTVERRPVLIAGFCADKDVDETLRILAPHFSRGIAVPIRNPRSMRPEMLRDKMQEAGLQANACSSLGEALAGFETHPRETLAVVCGSLFLAGEALVELNAYPWGDANFDPHETRRPSSGG